MTASNQEQFIFELAGEKIPVYSFNANEKMSHAFQINLTLASETEISFDKIGSHGLLTLKSNDTDRCFHGLVCEISRHDDKGRYKMYHLIMVPDLWLLSIRSNVRIFQNKSTVDIIKRVLKDAGISPGGYRFATQKSYMPRKYCVQYRETDYHFISRLMEEEGIYFYFEHTDSAHQIIFTDSTSAHPPIAGDPAIRFITRGALSGGHGEYITTIKKSCRIRTGKASIRDYNFKKPSYQLKSQNTQGRFTVHERYDYPGYFYEDGVGKIKSIANMENQSTLSETYTGSGLVPRFSPGYTFSIIDHDTGDFNITHTLLSAVHSGNQPQVLEAVSGEKGFSYTCAFTSIPSATQFRPDKRHAKPSVEGVQTAVVTGPPGEEIYTDQYGRIKVQFHWDRDGEKNEKTSCWMRVSQKWAGPGWGGLFLPRIGQEVIVDFVDGDPDRPLVTGCVYNGANMPPYPLPGEKTKSTIKTESSPGGGGYNEIRFEDKKGGEEIYIQAQKDQNQLVKNNMSTLVKNNRSLTVANNRTTVVQKENDTLTVEKGQRFVTVKDKETHENGADFIHTVSGNYKLTVGGNLDIDVGGVVTVQGSQIQLNP